MSQVHSRFYILANSFSYVSFKSKTNVIENGESPCQLRDIIFSWFMPIKDECCLDLCFVIFQVGALGAYLAIPLAMSSVAGTFKVLSFLTVSFVLQIKNQLE